MTYRWDGGWSVGEWLLMGFGMLLFWALLVAGPTWLVRSVAPDHRGRTEYARGEIDDEEYRRRREVLPSR